MITTSSIIFLSFFFSHWTWWYACHYWQTSHNRTKWHINTISCTEPHSSVQCKVRFQVWNFFSAYWRAWEFPASRGFFSFLPMATWQDGGLCTGNYFIWCAKAHPLYHHLINFNSQRQHFSFVSSCVQRWGGGEGGERSFKRQQSYRPGQHFSANCQGWMGKRLLSATACI